MKKIQDINFDDVDYVKYTSEIKQINDSLDKISRNKRLMKKLIKFKQRRSPLLVYNQIYNSSLKSFSIINSKKYDSITKNHNHFSLSLDNKSFNV